MWLQISVHTERDFPGESGSLNVRSRVQTRIEVVWSPALRLEQRVRRGGLAAARLEQRKTKEWLATQTCLIHLKPALLLTFNLHDRWCIFFWLTLPFLQKNLSTEKYSHYFKLLICWKFLVVFNFSAIDTGQIRFKRLGFFLFCFYLKENLSLYKMFGFFSGEIKESDKVLFVYSVSSSAVGLLLYSFPSRGDRIVTFLTPCT